MHPSTLYNHWLTLAASARRCGLCTCPDVSVCLAGLGPFQLQVKTRIQLQGKKGVGSGVYYDGMVDCFRKIIAQEGYHLWLNIRHQYADEVRGSFGRLYRGLVPPLMMEAPKRAVKFS